MTTESPRDAETLLRHTAFVRAVARAALRGDDLVDDVVQETWVAALEKGEGRRGPLGPWLAGVARNKARDLLRRRVATRRRERGAARSERVSPEQDVLDRLEVERRLLAAVEALPETYRTPLVLRYHEGLPPREVAQRLSMPVETVRTRVKRGLHELRRRLEADHGSGVVDWRLALLPLLHPGPAPSALATTALGGALMSSKVLVVAAAVVLLVGGVFYFAAGLPLPWGAADQSGAQDAGGVADAARAAEEVDAPFLVGRVPEEGDPRLPARFADVDRERDLHGVVVREDGSPIEGAEVTAVFRPWRDADMAARLDTFFETREGPQTRTAEDGSFVLRLERGDWTSLRFHHPGLARTELAGFQAGERVRVVLRPGVCLVVETRTLTGEPVGDLPLHLFSLSRTECNVDERARTDEAGRARFEGLVPGTTVVLVARELREGWGNPGWVNLTLPEQGEITHRLGAAPRVLQGRVTDARSGHPVGGADVSTNPAFIPAEMTDEGGRYRVHGAQGDGSFGNKLFVRAKGYATARVSLGSTDTQDVELSTALEMSGRVVDARGRAVGGALVSASAHWFQDGQDHSSQAAARSDRDGRFTLMGLNAAQGHGLRAAARGHGRVARWVSAAPAAPRVEVGDVVLAEPGRILGRVWGSGGEPVQRESVELTRRLHLGGGADARGLRIRRWTDDLGRFAFADLAPGPYVVQVGREYPPLFRETVELTEDELEVRLELRPPTTRELAVRVVDPHGDAVRGVGVHATYPNPRGVLAWATTDAAGVATLQVPVSELVVGVNVATKSPYRLPARRTVAAHEEAVEIRLEAAAILEGTLRDPDGEPIPEASIRATATDGKTYGMRTNDRGAFFLKLPDGLVVDLHFEGLVLDPEIQSDRRLPFVATLRGVHVGSEHAELSAVRVASDRTLTARVVDPTGAPVPRAMVQIAPVEPPAAGEWRQADGDGRVEFEGLGAWHTRVSGYLLDESTARWVPPEPQVVTPEGQEVVLRYTEGTVLEGRLVRPDGTSTGQAVVNVDWSETWRTLLLTDQQGCFVIALPAGRTVTLRAGMGDPGVERLMAVQENVGAGSGPLTLRLKAVPPVR